MERYILFYDGECGLCDRVVYFAYDHDKKGRFSFAPLQGETAIRWLPSDLRQQLDTVVLMEGADSGSPVFYTEGKAAFRMLWLLGGAWTLIGWKCFLPGWIYNWAYRLVARNRHCFFDRCPLRNQSSKRFLP